jgi:hypothetical protein
VESTLGYIAKPIKSVGLACIPQSKREHPHTLSLYQALELAWDIEQDAMKQANRKRQDTNKLSQLSCRVCGQKGHTWRDLDKNGVHKVSVPIPRLVAKELEKVP